MPVGLDVPDLGTALRLCLWMIQGHSTGKWHIAVIVRVQTSDLVYCWVTWMWFWRPWWAKWGVPRSCENCKHEFGRHLGSTYSILLKPVSFGPIHSCEYDDCRSCCAIDCLGIPSWWNRFLTKYRKNSWSKASWLLYLWSICDHRSTNHVQIT